MRVFVLLSAVLLGLILLTSFTGGHKLWPLTHHRSFDQAVGTEFFIDEPAYDDFMKRIDRWIEKEQFGLVRHEQIHASRNVSCVVSKYFGFYRGSKPFTLIVQVDRHRFDRVIAVRISQYRQVTGSEQDILLCEANANRFCDDFNKLFFKEDPNSFAISNQ